MNRKYLKIILVVLIIIIVVGVFYFLKNSPTPNMLQTQQSNQQINKSIDNFRYSEVIKEKVGVSGGVLQNSDKSVIITIPSLKQETEFTLSFKKSDFEVRSGVGSPVTIIISPDINLMDSPKSISIKVKYDSQYNLPVPYLIDENNKLHGVDIGDIDKVSYYFTMYTFHGGNYSWIYAN